MKNKTLIKTIIAFSALVFASQLYASELSAPAHTVQKVSSQLTDALQKNEAAIKANPKKELFKIVKTVVLPYIDLNNMVDVVLGRQGHIDWEKASKAKKQEFVDQFIILIVGTYSAALQQYDNQPVKVFPVRGFMPEATTAQVHSVLVTNNGGKIMLLYQLVKEGDAWKITDFSVEGISLIQSYQAQFQSIVQSKGLNGLIETLKKHNEQNS